MVSYHAKGLNDDTNRLQKRIIGPAFSPSSIAEVEPYVSEAGVDRLTERINTYAETGETFDIMELLQCTTLVSVLVAGFHLINGFL